MSAITTPRFLNISTRRVGGLRFIKIGRLCVSFCITQRYRPMKPATQFRLSTDGVLVLGYAEEA